MRGSFLPTAILPSTVPSLASLVYVIRGLASDSVDPRALGQQQLRWWADSLDAAMAARDKHSDKSISSSTFSLTRSLPILLPCFTVPTNVSTFRGSANTEGRMGTFLANNPRGKHGAHQYEIEDFGMSLAQIRERFEGYCDAYRIPLTL